MLSFPPFDLSFLIWIAFVPLLYALADISREDRQVRLLWINIHESSLAGYVFGMVFYFGTLHWFFRIFGLHALFLLLLLSVYPYLFARLFSFIYRKLNRDYIILFLPAVLWTAIEYVKSEGWWLKFSWMNIGYTQHNFLPVLHWANVIGQYGITALIFVINSIFVYILLNRSDNKKIGRALKWMLGIIVVVLLYGSLSRTPYPLGNIKVALVQDESSVFSSYKELMEDIDGDVQFIVLPEDALFEFLGEDREKLTAIGEIARRHNSYINRPPIPGL